MIINSVNFFSTIKTNQQIKHNYNFKINKLNSDTVSFSGTKKKNAVKKKQTSKEIESGVALGKKLIRASKKNALSISNIGIMFNENSPVPIYVDYLFNCPLNLPPATSAHMLPGYGEDLKLKQANIFINPSTQTEFGKADFVANAAHEYTHVLQRAKDKTYFGLTKYTNDVETIKYIIGTAQNIYNNLSSKLGQNLGYDERYSQSKATGKALDYASAKEIALKNISFEDEIYSNIIFSSIKNQEQHKKAMNIFTEKEYINIIKKCILQLAEFEKEAYTVTLETLEEIGNYAPETRVIRKAALDCNKMIIEQLKN